LTDLGAPSPRWPGTTAPAPPEGDPLLDHALTVEGAGLRTTRLRDVNGTLWHIPNGEIRRVGIRVRLVAKTRPLEQWNVAREVRARLKVAFDQAGIEVSAQQVLTGGGGQGQPAA
jgi:small-conductance mechanosensitive channel